MLCKFCVYDKYVISVCYMYGVCVLCVCSMYVCAMCMQCVYAMCVYMCVCAFVWCMHVECAGVCMHTPAQHTRCLPLLPSTLTS